MSTTQALLQAALNRVSARVGSGLVDAVATVAALAQEAPDRLRQEWELFVEEVELEADRIERAGPQEQGEDVSPVEVQPPSKAHTPSTQEQIDLLRARVAALSGRLEDLG